MERVFFYVVVMIIGLGVLAFILPFFRVTQVPTEQTGKFITVQVAASFFSPYLKNAAHKGFYLAEPCKTVGSSNVCDSWFVIAEKAFVSETGESFVKALTSTHYLYRYEANLCKEANSCPSLRKCTLAGEDIIRIREEGGVDADERVKSRLKDSTIDCLRVIDYVLKKEELLRENEGEVSAGSLAQLPPP